MTIRHSAGSYEVDFCSLGEAISRLPADSIYLTDENVEALYRKALPPSAQVLTVPAGEASKSIGQWAELQSRLAQWKAGRKTSLVAFGGGVIGDLAGFVAATYMRGVPLYQIPTTVLAQVDSSVGGKVGIDLPEGKNLVGAFYPPRTVAICTETLATLSDREFSNGMAEVWKYGFILDSALCDSIRQTGSLREPGAIDPIVRRCIELKKQVVEEDEFETKGERAKLNFGHTVGHAVEKLTGYGPVLHGEAISIGMVVEAQIGEAIGLSEPGMRATVEESLRSQGLPTTSVVLRDVDMLIETMLLDKKASGGRLAFSLLTSIGACKLVEDVPISDVRGVLERL
ncbi:MAG TPA: 3-dehydroquinate synthase [Fimbriimonadaceae bacterium]|nr:3-dehydroquinate synthase [Fimbriimonadaceae bacterium]